MHARRSPRACCCLVPVCPALPFACFSCQHQHVLCVYACTSGPCPAAGFLTHFVIPLSPPIPSFMRLLEDEAARGPYSSYINVLRNTEATEIQRDLEGQVSVTLRNTQLNSSMTFSPNLVLGCDGINSVVRSTLHSWAASNALVEGSAPASKFDMVLAPSLSTNLRFKVLQLPANPPMADGTVLENPSFCLLAGQKAPLIGEFVVDEGSQCCGLGGTPHAAAHFFWLRPAESFINRVPHTHLSIYMPQTPCVFASAAAPHLPPHTCACTPLMSDPHTTPSLTYTHTDTHQHRWHSPAAGPAAHQGPPAGPHSKPHHAARPPRVGGH